MHRGPPPHHAVLTDVAPPLCLADRGHTLETGGDEGWLGEDLRNLELTMGVIPASQILRGGTWREGTCVCQGWVQEELNPVPVRCEEGLHADFRHPGVWSRRAYDIEKR